MQQWEYITVRQEPRTDSYNIHGFGRYGKSSVLAGQSRKVFLGTVDADDIQEALVKVKMLHPDTDVNIGSNWTDPTVSLSHLPDDDEYGGRWEDDY